MKKIYVILIIVLLVIPVVSLLGFNYFKNKNSDAIRFQSEYEALNESNDGSGNLYLEMEIDSKNPIYYASFDEIMSLLDNGTGVIYFGFPECPWCRNAVPVLLEAAKETSIDKIYYFDAYEMRDSKSLDETGKIITKKKGTKEYNQLLNKLDSILGPYQGLHDESIKRLYFPTVVFVQDGKIIGAHEGTLDSQKSPYEVLTELETEKLKKVYTDLIHKMLKDMCTTKC